MTVVLLPRTWRALLEAFPLEALEAQQCVSRRRTNYRLPREDVQYHRTRKRHILYAPAGKRSCSVCEPVILPSSNLCSRGTPDIAIMLPMVVRSHLKAVRSLLRSTYRRLGPSIHVSQSRVLSSKCKRLLLQFFFQQPYARDRM